MPNKEPSSDSSRPPNIILFYSDSHRYDAMGCAGNSAIQTPNLDGMAENGVHFTNTFCQGPLCQPSRASMITGKYIRDHGIHWNRMNMDPEWTTFMKQLQGAGYRTSLVGKTHFLSSRMADNLDLRVNSDAICSFGFDYALEQFDSQAFAFPITTAYSEFVKEKGLLDIFLKEVGDKKLGDENQFDGITSEIPEEHSRISFTADNALNWLDAYDDKQPYFLWVSFVEPHFPFIDYGHWAEFYKDKEIPLGNMEPLSIPDNAYGQYLKKLESIGYLGRREKDYILNCARHYYGMISLMDQRIGDIIKAVRDRGEEDNTYLIYTSDHGEMLGQHGLMTKLMFYKGSALVPTIIQPPQDTKTKVITAPTQSIDITATILDAAGADPIEGAGGRSLLPAMQGESLDRDIAFSELCGLRGEGNYFVMAATERYRYVYDRDNDLACEFFDLENDPDEDHNLVNDPAYEGIRQDIHKDYVIPFLEGKNM